jgi:mannose-6-phosphate isomerase-like protein (cupin superfamily)
MSYTIKNLSEVEDSAAKYGFGEIQEARFPREDLDAEATGFLHLRLRAGRRQPFAHRHETAEEIYLVLEGTGQVKLDDDVIDIKPHDAIRISPGVTRALQAGPDGDLVLLAFGPRVAGDGEMVQDFWD